jgi:hypothetical protein
MRCSFRSFWVGFTLLTVVIPSVFAHDPRLELPDPKSVPEAWNVIVESTNNAQQLIDLGQWPDVAFQLANTSPALRLLEARAGEMGGDKDSLIKLSQRLLHTGFDVVLASRESDHGAEKAAAKWREYQAVLAELKARYPADVVASPAFICPMHPKDVHTASSEKCSICRMSLVRRHIPASDVYERPGEPSIKMTIVAPALEVGKACDVKIQLRRASDSTPVVLRDLIEMHTRKIHLLINDRSLSDYHHEHPTPTGVAGEYAFSFTPERPGPYRVWADVVPASTGIQEYVIADIAAATTPLPLDDKETVSTAFVNGRRYDLALQTGGKPVRAGEVINGTLTVTAADGQPFKKLEPVMAAYAHIVGFSEDGHTVLHIHPLGDEPNRDDLRGGPTLAFRFYAPEPGFIRLYGQVQVDGISQFPAFGVPVLPAEKK